MRVILVKNVQNVGGIGDTVSVSRGYAIHYLMVNKLAIYATEKNYSMVKQQEQTLKQDLESEIAQLKKITEQLKDITLKFTMPASKEGKLFGSITAKQIAKSLSTQNSVKISHLNIKLNEPIKLTGIYNIKIIFPNNITSNVKLVIAESEAMIEKCLNTEKKSE